MSTGYNWRATLTSFASISGVLAGFCITFIALILRGEVRDIDIVATGVTFSQITILLFGISTTLFICAIGFFLHATELDVVTISESYAKYLKRAYGIVTDKEWEEEQDRHTAECYENERVGRVCHNFALLLMFLGLFFAIAPYSFVVGVIVGGLGVSFELWQLELGERSTNEENNSQDKMT